MTAAKSLKTVNLARPAIRETTRRGSLTIVGTGINILGQLTIEAKAAIEQAEHVIYLVADVAAERWIKAHSASSESLMRFYGDGDGKPRPQSYREMTDCILSHVRSGKDVCAVFYGHPGVFVQPAHAAIREARAEGFGARMLPGISAQACLFSDLGLDPGECGCQAFEATDFLIYKRAFDPASLLIIWQIGVIGELGYRSDRKYDLRSVQVLVDYLLTHYAPQHEVIVYEAAESPVVPPNIRHCPLEGLGRQKITPGSTLCVPPLPPRAPDNEMLDRLRLRELFSG